MKILHVCLGNFYIENMSYQENILPKFHKLQGNDVKIIASQYSFDAEGNIKAKAIGSYINKDGIPITVLPYKKLPLSRIIKVYGGVYHEFEQYCPDIIFVHGPQFSSNLQLKKYKKKNPNVKIICDNHSDYINTPGSPLKYYILNRVFWPMIVKRIIKTVDYFWGVTPMRVNFLRKVYNVPKNKSDLLIMGGDDTLIDYENKTQIRAAFRCKYNIPPDHMVFITGGKLSSGKKIDELLKAFKTINNLKVSLVIFGAFPEICRATQEICKNTENVHFIGWLDAKETYEAFLSSDVGVFPGTHSVLWEQAAACGLPCIFKKWKDMDHVLVDGNCVLSETTDAETLSLLIKRFIDDNIYYNYYRDGAERSRWHFSYSEIAKKAIEIQ